MMRSITCLIFAIILLSSCSLLQRGAILGTFFGNTARQTMNLTGTGMGKLFNTDSSTFVGLMSGPPTYELTEANRQLLLSEGLSVDPETGEVKVSSKALAAYEKHITLMQAQNLALIAQNKRLIEASKTLANTIGADGRTIQVTTTSEGGLQITIISEILFMPNSAQIKPALYPVIDEIGAVINNEYPDSFVAIEGHTGLNEASQEYISNWELSAARALSVLHYFDDQNLIAASRMAIAGYSSNRPVASPETTNGKIANRRVVINVMPNFK